MLLVDCFYRESLAPPVRLVENTPRQRDRTGLVCVTCHGIQAGPVRSYRQGTQELLHEKGFLVLHLHIHMYHILYGGYAIRSLHRRRT